MFRQPVFVFTHPCLCVSGACLGVHPGLSLCFAGLSVNNLLLVLDRIVYATSMDLSTWRLVAALVALLPLLYGLIWED